MGSRVCVRGRWARGGEDMRVDRRALVFCSFEFRVISEAKEVVGQIIRVLGFSR